MSVEGTRAAAAAALAVLIASLTGCRAGGFGETLEGIIYRPNLEPNFERPSDLMAPEALRVTSSADRQVGLSWNPVLVGDVAGYAVTRSEVEEGPYTTVGRTVGRFSAVFSDSGEGPAQLGDGKTYYYRVYAFDSDGHVSTQFTVVSTRTEARPSAPNGFQAYSNLPRRVALSWEPSPSNAVIGYSIFRSPSTGGAFENLSFVKGRLNTVFEDRVPGDLRVMYYKVQAVNRFGGLSDLSEPVRAVTKPEPLPPTGLSAAPQKLGHVQLRWQPNVETDLIRYEIWRSTGDGEGIVASIAPDTTEFLDRALGCGQRVRYRLRAVDRDGLQSDFSAPIEVTALDLGLELAKRPDGGFELRWQKAATAGGWPVVRVVERRSLFPDRELGVARIDAALPLSLPPGRHTIAATLTYRTPEASPRELEKAGADAPTCSAGIVVPQD